MDRFDTMKAFVRVVEAGSFTKAADTLHMSRTTVTQLVQQLEARLQLKLLHLLFGNVFGQTAVVSDQLSVISFGLNTGN